MRARAARADRREAVPQAIRGVPRGAARQSRQPPPPAVVAHCPVSNTLLGSGVMALEKVRGTGRPMALCTDVGASPTTWIRRADLDGSGTDWGFRRADSVLAVAIRNGGANRIVDRFR